MWINLIKSFSITTTWFLLTLLFKWKRIEFSDRICIVINFFVKLNFFLFHLFLKKERTKTKSSSFSIKSTTLLLKRQWSNARDYDPGANLVLRRSFPNAFTLSLSVPITIPSGCIRDQDRFRSNWELNTTTAIVKSVDKQSLQVCLRISARG